MSSSLFVGAFGKDDHLLPNSGPLMPMRTRTGTTLPGPGVGGDDDFSGDGRRRGSGPGPRRVFRPLTRAETS